VAVNGLGFTSAPFDLAMAAVDGAAREAREALYDIHLEVVGRGRAERTRYRAGQTKPRAELEDDVRRLAFHGSSLFTGLAGALGPTPPPPGDAGAPPHLYRALRRANIRRRII
jgi:hypothetical protein